MGRDYSYKIIGADGHEYDAGDIGRTYNGPSGEYTREEMIQELKDYLDIEGIFDTLAFGVTLRFLGWFISGMGDDDKVIIYSY